MRNVPDFKVSDERISAFVKNVSRRRMREPVAQHIDLVRVESAHDCGLAAEDGLVGSFEPTRLYSGLEIDEQVMLFGILCSAGNQYPVERRTLKRCLGAPAARSPNE
jgi:hypothetical protein